MGLQELLARSSSQMVDASSPSSVPQHAASWLDDSPPETDSACVVADAGVCATVLLSISYASVAGRDQREDASGLCQGRGFPVRCVSVSFDHEEVDEREGEGALCACGAYGHPLVQEEVEVVVVAEVVIVRSYRLVPKARRKRTDQVWSYCVAGWFHLVVSWGVCGDVRLSWS